MNESNLRRRTLFQNYLSILFLTALEILFFLATSTPANALDFLIQEENGKPFHSAVRFYLQSTNALISSGTTDSQGLIQFDTTILAGQCRCVEPVPQANWSFFSLGGCGTGNGSCQSGFDRACRLTFNPCGNPSGNVFRATRTNFKVSPTVFGGTRGYINPNAGESAQIVIKPDGNGYAKFEIYNLSGRVVSSFQKYLKRNTQNVVTWNGRNNNGVLVPSGVYILNIDHDGKNTKTKIAVMRK